MSKNDSRERLRDCLVQLLLTKRIEKIRIAELCEAAKISRRTFYLYYESIYDLLQEVEDNLLLSLRQAGEEFTKTHSLEYENLYEFNLAIYTHILNQRDRFLALLGRYGDISFHYRYRTQIKNNYLKLFKFKKELEHYNSDIISYFMASGNEETIVFWLETQCCSIEEFARIMQIMLYKAFSAMK